MHDLIVKDVLQKQNSFKEQTFGKKPKVLQSHVISVYSYFREIPKI